MKRLWRIILGGLVLTTASVIPANHWLQFTLYATSYAIAGGDVLVKAVRNLLGGQVLDENFLMSIATMGAFIIGEYPEGIAVMLFYQVGELFQSYAIDRSRKSIANLMDIRPDYANVRRGDALVRVDPEEVKIGEIIVVKVGEKVPLDARIVEGSTMMDTAALTGEALPREVNVGDEILSGCINMSSVVAAEAITEFGDSTVSKILELVENASSKKSTSEQFITRFARYYTPAVVVIAALLAFVPPLVVEGAIFGDWLYKALTFLVVSCPCALVVSIPLTFFGGLGGASRNGILVKGSNYLEALAQAEVVVLDKTGTLTKGVFDVQGVYPTGISREELLELAAHAESYSNHPISLSLRRAYSGSIEGDRIGDVEEIPGHGVKAKVDQRLIAAGNGRLMASMNIPYFQGEIAGTVVHVALEDQYVGYIVITDEVKEDAAQAVRDLREAGIKQIVMLTGDSQRAGSKVAEELALDGYYAELLPAGKVEKLESLISETSPTGKLAFVGDGINDAPVLARADIGIAMGGLGSDAAIEAADVVIMTDEPSKLATAIRISRKTLTIARQNIVFSIGVKVAVLILSAIGLATMWEAVFADVGVTVIAVLNAFRALGGARHLEAGMTPIASGRSLSKDR